MALKIVHPDCIQELQGFSGTWVYADENLSEYQATLNVMGKSASRLVTPEDFQEKALELQAPFVRWVDDCLKGKPSQYWLTTPLRKNTFDSRLFLHLVWLVCVVPALTGPGANIAVVTRSLGLVRALKQYCRGHSLECRAYGKARFLLGQAKSNTTVFVKWFGKVLNLVCRGVLSKAILGKRYILDKLVETEILVETYLHEGDLKSDGEFSDRYFPGLHDFYLRKRINSACFPFLHRTSLLRCCVTYSRMRNSTIPFAPFELFIKIRDVLRAAVESLKSALTAPPVKTFCGLTVGGLVNAERFCSALGGVIPLALLHVPRRMLAEGVQPDWFIDWFENQALDKGIILGFHKGMPSCRTVAARLYIPSRNMTSLFTSPGEAIAQVAPTENWVCGKALKTIVGLHAPPGVYRVMPALRYGHLYGDPPVAGNIITLLILLSHSLEESLGILDCAAPVFGHSAQWGVKVVIKPHPDTEVGLLRSKMAERLPDMLSEQIEWTNQKLAELLPVAGVVVASGTSSAVEAVCRGVPVVMVGRMVGLDYNPLEWVDKRMWEVVYTAEQLVAAVYRKFMDTALIKTERRRVAEEIKQDFFMEVNTDNMHRFLPVNFSLTL